MKKPINKIVYYCIFFVFINSISYGAEIHKAAVDGDLIKLGKLIKKGIDINSYDTEPGSDYDYPKGTSLHWAVRAGQKEAVLFLIKNGADVNAKTDDGVSLMVETPLDYAVWQRNLELAKILLHAGANVNECGFNLSKSEIYSATYNLFNTPLHIAVKIGNLNYIKLLLKAGANVNLKNRNGETPIDIAQGYGSSDILTLLKK